MIRLGVVCVYDPDTGWATHPVAAVVWNDDRPVAWSWVPLDHEARELRYLTVDELTDLQQVAWLEEHAADPTPTGAVTIVDSEVDEATASIRVEALLDEILIVGA